MDSVIMKTNVLALSSRNEFDQAVYQEDILIELSERLALEMEYAQIHPEELQKLLGKNGMFLSTKIDIGIYCWQIFFLFLINMLSFYLLMKVKKFAI